MIDRAESLPGAGERWLAVAEEAFVPSDSGGRVESINMLRAASAAGIALRVVVPGVVDDAELAAHRRALPGTEIVGIPRRTGMIAHLSTAPYVFVSRPMGRNVVDECRDRHRAAPWTAVLAVSFRVAHLGIELAEHLGVPLVVRPHNLESGYFAELARSARGVRSLPYKVEAWKLRRAESAVHRSAAVTLFADISAGDAEDRTGRTSRPVLHVPPFMPSRTPAATGGPDRDDGERVVLFLGSLDNANNEAGLRWFVTECWPSLRGFTSLHVVGRRAGDSLRSQLQEAGVRVTVDAPDVGPHLAGADVFINPVRAGSGINIKVIEAMAEGIPVVSTAIGARGLDWRDGEHLLIRDDVEGFSSAVSGLLSDHTRREALGAAGRRFVIEELDGVRQISRLVEALRADASGVPG